MRYLKSSKLISILIPTFNNLKYLKLCVESIHEHSGEDYEIIVHVNDGSDGTLDWVKEQNLTYSRTETNVGVSVALNMAKEKSTGQYLIYANDDFYTLPLWDSILYHSYKVNRDSNEVWVSGTMIEPYGNNPIAISGDYGRNPETFDKDRLLKDFDSFKTLGLRNTVCPPVLLSRNGWEKLGGYDENIFAAGSDAHLAKKAYDLDFQFVQADSYVYHFMSKTVGKIKDPRKHNDLFKARFGLTINDFYTKQLVVGKK